MEAPPPTTDVRPVLRWPGSKRRMLKQLLPLLPTDAKCYCEVFAGSAALLLAKPRHPVEVINDLNGDIVCLMRNAQFHLPALLAELRWLVASRKDFFDYRDQPGVTEIQRAARFLLRNRISFSGGMRTFGVAKLPGGDIAIDRDRMELRLEAIRVRLDKVLVENLPFERCLKNYDGPGTVFFMAPPYVDSRPDSYAAWTQEEMRNFRDRVALLKGRWIITVNDSPENRDLFSGCTLRAISTPNRRGNKRTEPEVTFGELLITP